MKVTKWVIKISIKYRRKQNNVTFTESPSVLVNVTDNCFCVSHLQIREIGTIQVSYPRSHRTTESSPQFSIKTFALAPIFEVIE